MAPAPKRRKTGPSRPTKHQQVEELPFDFDAREDYLTGFHKRKVARTKKAQEEGVKMAREERIKDRRQLREQRKQDLDAHVKEVNTVLRAQNPDLSPSPPPPSDTSDNEEAEWNGIDVGTTLETDEYLDPDRHTTVTIESLDSAAAFANPAPSDAEVAKEKARVAEKVKAEKEAEDIKRKKQARWKNEDGSKVKKKKFRYESKGERQQTRRKQKAKNSKQAAARKGE